jgi:hypothetical protein
MTLRQRLVLTLGWGIFLLLFPWMLLRDILEGNFLMPCPHCSACYWRFGRYIGHLKAHGCLTRERNCAFTPPTPRHWN